MPPKLVKPGLEEYWRRAKAAAEDQGHGEDYAYIVGIFKTMTLNKSEYLAKGDIRTGQSIPMFNRWPGQIPDSKGLEAKLMLQRVDKWNKPKEDRAVLQIVPNARYCVESLGMDIEREEEWAALLVREVHPQASELQLRQLFLGKMREDRMDPGLRRPFWDRILAYIRHVQRPRAELEKSQGGLILDLRKSRSYVIADELEKGAGHKYLRRWRGPDGKYKYEYKALATGTLRTYSVGDKVSVKHKGQEGHFEVLKVRTKDGKRQLYVRHDETGKDRWVSESVLGELFRQTHNVQSQARQATHKIDAALAGYDPKEGPGGPKLTKPLPHWKKQLEERRARLSHLFDPHQQYHSMMDFGAKQELLGWYKEELGDVVEQVKPVIEAMHVEVDAAHSRNASFAERQGIQSKYIKETKASFNKMFGGVNTLVQDINWDMRSEFSDQKGNSKHSDPTVSAQVQEAHDAGKGLDKSAQAMIMAMTGVFNDRLTPDKWSKAAKGKITKYFNLLDKANFAATAARAAEVQYREEGHHGGEQGSPVTDRVSHADAEIVIHGKHVKHQYQVSRAIASVEGSFANVKRAGFGRALDDMTLHLDWAPEQKRAALDVGGHGTIQPAGLYATAGRYDPGKKGATKAIVGEGDVILFATGFRDGLPSNVLTHEIGHRYYFRSMTKGERLEWNEEVDKRSIIPTQAQVSALWDVVEKTHVEKDMVTGEEFIEYRWLVGNLAENHGPLGRALASRIRSVFPDPKFVATVSVAKIKELTDSLVDHPIVDPFVSFYGGTNAFEYFAEAFMYYVDGGAQNVPSWTRSIFEKLTARERMKKSMLFISSDLLAKGVQRGGKYLKRVPYTDSHGKRKYKYYYKESAIGRSAETGEEVKVGDQVAKVTTVTEKGAVTVEIDGTTKTFLPGEWHKELAKHYGEAVGKNAEKRARQTINAVLRHVPAEMLQDLKGATDAERLAELETRVPAVYKKLQAAFKRAGMSPYDAQRVLAKTLERRGWAPESRALAIGTVLKHRGTSITTLIDASENLAGGATVEPKHVAAAGELGAAGKGEPLTQIKKVAAKAEKELAKLAIMLAQLQGGEGGSAAEVFKEALGAEAMQKLNLLSQAFPGLADKAVQPTKDVLAAVSAEMPSKPQRDGAETIVFVAGEGGKPKSLKAQYKLVEASELKASHSADSFAKREDYPAGVQERAYHRDRAEQEKVIRNAQRLDPRFVVNTNPDAVNGPPMITNDGIVLGGNSRTMSIQRLYKEHPDKAAELKKYMADHAHETGFKPADIEAMKNPVLIRELTLEDKSKPNMQLLVRQMNETFTQAMDPRTMQVAQGRRLTDDAMKSLAKSMGEDETLAEFLATKRSQPFVDALGKAGIIDERNSNQYFQKGTKTLNQDGVQLVSRILVGRTVQDADILSASGPQLIESIARAVPTLTQARAHGEGYDLGDDLAIAISAFNDLQHKANQGVIASLDPKMKDKFFQGLFNNFETLPGIAEPHPVLGSDKAKLLLELLIRKRGPKQMAKFAKAYAQGAANNPEGQSSLLAGAVKTPTDVLRDTVRGALGKEPALIKSIKVAPEKDPLEAAQLVQVGDGLLKLVKSKYTRRWRGPDGNWRYEYGKPDQAKNAQLILPLARASINQPAQKGQNMRVVNRKTKDGKLLTVDVKEHAGKPVVDIVHGGKSIGLLGPQVQARAGLPGGLSHVLAGVVALHPAEVTALDAAVAEVGALPRVKNKALHSARQQLLDKMGLGMGRAEDEYERHHRQGNTGAAWAARKEGAILEKEARAVIAAWDAKHPEIVAEIEDQKRQSTERAMDL